MWTDLSRTVKEVVLDVSRDRVDAILNHPLLCSHTGSGKVRLECACTAVCLGDGVGVIGPNYWRNKERSGCTSNAIGGRLTMTEHVHKFWVILQPLLDAQHTRLDKLSLQRILCQRRLRDIGSVQAVHAV